MGVASIDKALSAGDFHSLMEVTNVHDFADLLTADLDSSYQQSADDVGTVSVPQSLEAQLLIKHAQTISDLEKQIDDDPVHPCCSCECLQQRKCVTRVSLSDNIGSKVWPALKAFIVEHNSGKYCTCVTTVSHSSSKTYFQHVVYSMAYKRFLCRLNWQNWIV